MTAFVMLLVIAVVGVAVFVYRNRPHSSIESGISSFRREMRALAPPGQRRQPPASGDNDEPPPDRPAPGAS